MTAILQGQKSIIPLSWGIYSVLVIVRIFVGPFLPGYVHPDEFFQGGQELWFGCPPFVPWEFEPENPIRSILPPTLITWLPLRIYSFLVGRPMGRLSSTEVLVLPRMVCALFSVLAVDWSLWSITKESNTRGVPLPVLLSASAWPSLVLFSRPFSNTLESFCLALLMRMILQKSFNTINCMAIGVVCALGLFTRFTFCFFAFPAVVVFLHQMLQVLGLTATIPMIILTGLSFLAVSIGVVYEDTTFFASQREIDTQNDPSIVLTPWNALSYNSKVSNLKEHGLHPRWTHTLVNMFLLYGPMTLIFYISLLSTKAILLPRKELQLDSKIAIVSRWVILFGLGLLSIAPHQEPRFLLPLITPLVLAVAKNIPYTRAACGIWILFNAALLAFFGILHQAGVVKSLLAVGSTLSHRQPTSIIYFHTYMPPSFLSRLSQKSTCPISSEDLMICQQGDEDHYGGVCRDIPIVDLKGSSVENLRDTLHELLECSIDHSSGKGYIHLITPPSMETIDGRRWSLSGNDCEIPGYKCAILWSYSPHLTTEDPPSFDGSLLTFYQGMNLNIYEITCL